MKTFICCLITFLLIGWPLTSLSAPVPHFSGPLLADTGITVDMGDTDLEPHLFYSKFEATKQWQGLLQITQGLTSFADLQILPSYIRNSNSTHTHSNVGDSLVSLGLQLIRQNELDHGFSLKFDIGEIFPTGDYHLFNEEEAEVSSTGDGVFQTILGINFLKQSQLGNDHRLNTYVTLDLLLPQKNSIKGFNRYGGATNARGQIRPGNLVDLDVALEYQIHGNFIGVLEGLYTWRGKSSFSGTPGVNEDNVPQTPQEGSASIFSFAPALEYSINRHLGIITGLWFSVGAKKEEKFKTAQLTISYTLTPETKIKHEPIGRSVSYS